MKKFPLLSIFLFTVAWNLLACRAITNFFSSPVDNTLPSSPNTPSNSYILLHAGDFEAVIVPQEQASDFLYSLHGERTTENWTPTEEDILQLEEQINAYLEELPPNSLMPLSEYQRQYAGAIIKEHRLLYGNYFCQTFDVDWHKRPLVVLDGGNCFFQVVYDIQTQDFVSFNINGEG